MPRAPFTPGRAGARTLDAADELHDLRRRFELPREHGSPLTYLCGHSLGLMPRSVRRIVGTELDRWAMHAVDGHFPDERHGGWLDYHTRFAAPLAALVGAERGEVVAMNTLTVNLHLMLATFFAPSKKRYKILIERDAFSSDRYAVESHLRWHGLDPKSALLEIGPRRGSFELDADQFDDAARLKANASRSCCCRVCNIFPASASTSPRIGGAQAYGCRIGFDLAHAIGNVPLALHDSGADFAVWCSYKYLNAGPGAVGGCFVHERHAEARDLPRFAGWWGHDRARRFLMEPHFMPLRGAEGWQLSNPPILSLAPLAASLELFATAGLKRLRRKSERLTRYLEWLLTTELGDRVRILTPRDPARRGCHLAAAVRSSAAQGTNVHRTTACGWRRGGLAPTERAAARARAPLQPLPRRLRRRRSPQTHARRMTSAPRVAIIGGGPAGSLLAILLARRGIIPTVIERSPSFVVGQAGDRSINLALAARGITALRRAGIDAEVARLMIAMRGRMLHEQDGKQRFLSYGQRATEEIYSVSRAALNALLFDIAANRYAVQYRFGETCVGVDVVDGAPLIAAADGSTRRLDADVVFATDGAGSEVRRALADAGEISATEELLDHGYKELTIGASQDGGFALEPHALHIWPRGRFMLIALPNPERTFTATLFLPHTGDPSFASVGPNEVSAFFRREFTDAVPLLPALTSAYVGHPTGHLGTVTC